MNKFYTLLIVALLSTGFFTACNDNYEDYTTSPNDILTFSQDTLSFDTLFSTIGSTTLKFKVYNHNSKPLLISSAYLAGAGQSGFRINIDGNRGHTFSDVEIRAKDSIYVSVEATLDENTFNNPILMLDSVIFITNSVTQKVILQAYGQDVYIWKGGSIIETDSVLNNDKPYLIYDSLVVRQNTTLTVPEGVQIYMHNKASIDIYGTLKIEGTQAKPVTIRGDRLDSFYGIPYDRRQPGQWSGIYFSPESFQNTINYAHIRNGRYGLIFEKSEPAQSKLKLSNSVLTNVSYDLFAAENCDIEVSNCEFSNAGGALAYLNGGKYSFIQCTLANYYIWDTRTSASLSLRNFTKEGNTTIPLPLLQADFLNCIIYGTRTDEIAFNPVKEADAPGVAFNYLIDYCLIRMKQDSINTKPNITHYITNQDPKFKTINNENCIWNFQLEAASPAVNTGNVTIASSAPFDMNGINRLLDAGPDRGAYEWVPSE